MDRFGDEKAVTIRQPAIANLMIDSADRTYDLSGTYKIFKTTPFDFSIYKNESILNGFFTRIGTSEVVLEWDIPNVGSQTLRNEIFFDVSGIPLSTTLAQGFYNVSDILTALPRNMNTSCQLSGIPSTIANFSTSVFGDYANTITNFGSADYRFNANQPLIDRLISPSKQVTPNKVKIVNPQPDLRAFRYIDFVSYDLTYNQKLKDSSTALEPKDVLNRWYFDWDDEPSLDALGYPIYMGYTPFRSRRLYNPPKQIKWYSAMPIGNLGFQVYGDNGSNLSYLSNMSVPGDPFPPTNSTNWLMTLQVSEN